MLTIFKRIFSGVASGVLVSIGGCVYLLTEWKIAGAILFSVALLSICYKGFSLFTGKVGYIAHSRTKAELSVLFTGLLGNFIGAVGAAALACLAVPSLHETAVAVANAKIGQAFYETLFRAFFCGILMYLAVSIYKEKNSPLGIIFCIPTFILCGFEHSIADIFYLSAGVTFTAEYILKALLFIVLAIIGNAVGAIFIALFDKSKETPDGKK